MAQDQARSDAHWVREALTGDREAFAVLVDRYRRPIYALALQKVRDPADAEDVAQEAFIKAYRSLHTLRDPVRFGRWLYSIAIRGAADWLRLRGRRIADRRAAESRTGGGGSRRSDRLEPVASPFEVNTEVQELVHAVMYAVGELTDAHRLVVTLRYIHGLSAKQIAEQLGEPRGTVRSRLFKAAQILRRRLANLISAE